LILTAEDCKYEWVNPWNSDTTEVIKKFKEKYEIPEKPK